MKTLLIVEDEKLIRQGIKVMVQRSGVPVESIMECSNGEAALKILNEQKIDVMLTDIRMPKMDGIELVRIMQDCAHVPATIAISGYDDFSYAVEMLRNGVREYILKPIERDKLAMILKKLNDELESRDRQEQTNKQLGLWQIKQLMLGIAISDEERTMLEAHYADSFFREEYCVCCQSSARQAEYEAGNYIFLEDIEGNNIFIVPKSDIQRFMESGTLDSYVGVSAFHCGIESINAAYKEALQMRKRAFMRNADILFFEEFSKNTEHIAESLINEAQKLISENARQQRVQLLGTHRTNELIKSFDGLFWAAQKGRISAEEFECGILGFLDGAEATYKSIFASGNDRLAQQISDARLIWSEECIDAYREKLMQLVFAIHEKLGSQEEISGNTQKIRDAIAYIEKHYAEDLNMAVVSNYISMNYSLFSYLFKQYTGSSFVSFLKDIRMREAKKLLADTDMRIIEISHTVGYENEKHFMKLFKSTYGISPTEYRRNMNR